MTMSAEVAEITKRMSDAGAVVAGKKIKFDFGADGKIMLDGVANAVTNDDADADTTLSVSLADFLDMASGKLNGMNAFMSGKLKVAGDMGNAMQLQSVMAKLA